jgi:hypothetical protein
VTEDESFIDRKTESKRKREKVGERPKKKINRITPISHFFSLEL